MTIKTTTNTITNIDTFIVMIRKHIITIEDTPKGIGTNPETTPIDTEKRENLQNAMGTRINGLFLFSSVAIQPSKYFYFHLTQTGSTGWKSPQKLNVCLELPPLTFEF